LSEEVVALSDLRKQLIAYGLDLLAQAAGRQEAAAGLVGGLSGLRAGWNRKVYERILGPRPTPEQALSSIFSWVALPDLKGERHLPETVYYAARALALDRETLFPCTVQTSEVSETSEVVGKRPATAEEAWAKSDLGGLWRDFEEEYKVLQERFGSDGDAFFESFYHLYHKYAWALPNAYGEPGVSLFQQWKTVAALALATGEKWADGPADKFTLIGGDIPGIQDFVYTITSKGAAKGLRGRSFFLQLLGDAVVRRLVADLGLCSCNVVYAAGGNFTLLAPVDSGAALKGWQEMFNRALLDEFEGDLYLALAWEELSQSAVGTSEFVGVREQLGKRVAAAKSRRFSEVVEAGEEIEKNRGWAILFEPKGQGGLDHCQVCQREPRPGEKLVTETTEAGETVNKCEQCRSFEKLARDIAHDRLWMVVTEAGPATQNKGWQGTLARLTGFGYRFQKEPPQVSGPALVYVLNLTNPEESRARGFRFLANATPCISDADRQWVQKHHPDLEVLPGERIWRRRRH
jgi:CRISPR-associated protein Cas10/Csm1 subtype III-A